MRILLYFINQRSSKAETTESKQSQTWSTLGSTSRRTLPGKRRIQKPSALAVPVVGLVPGQRVLCGHFSCSDSYGRPLYFEVIFRPLRLHSPDATLSAIPFSTSFAFLLRIFVSPGLQMPSKSLIVWVAGLKTNHHFARHGDSVYLPLSYFTANGYQG